MDRLGFEFDEKLRSDTVFNDRFYRDELDAKWFLREEGQLFFGVLTGVGFEGHNHRFEGEWVCFEQRPVYDPCVMQDGNESLTEARKWLKWDFRESFPFEAQWTASGNYNIYRCDNPRRYAMFLTDGETYIKSAQCRYSEYTEQYAVIRFREVENTIRDTADCRSWRMVWYDFTDKEDGVEVTSFYSQNKSKQASF